MSEQIEIANIVQKQITRNTLACVGASNYVALPRTDEFSGGLGFKTRVDNQNRRIQIELNYCDTYTVKQILIRKNKANVKFQATDVYCDNLDEVVYRIGSTRHANSDWLAEVGIETF